MTNADIQRALLAHGYDLGKSGPGKDGVDGVLGPKSEAGIKGVQKAAGLPETGKVDAATEKALTAAPVLASRTLDKASEAKLVGVHPDLVRVVRRAAEISAVAFRVTEGVRTLARQRQLLAKGASQTLRSRHIPAGRPALAHAIDLAAVVGGTIRWDWPLYDRLASAMKQAATDLGITIEWGGDWKTFKDGPHFQLPWAKYPG